jgi:hypothetical protein
MALSVDITIYLHGREVSATVGQPAGFDIREFGVKINYVNGHFTGSELVIKCNGNVNV